MTYQLMNMETKKNKNCDGLHLDLDNDLVALRASQTIPRTTWSDPNFTIKSFEHEHINFQSTY